MTERDEPEEAGEESTAGPDAGDLQDQGSGQESETERGRRLPAPDPDAREEGKRFAVPDALRNAPLVVTVGGGEVASTYAPAQLVSRLGAHVHRLLHDLGGGYSPMFYGALGGASMRLFFGDAQPEEAQAQLPLELTLEHAKRVAELIDLEGDELFARALELGSAARPYGELARFVQAEGVTLRWQPRGEPERRLEPEAAEAQWTRLSAEPQKRDRALTIHGVLYRVIAEPHDGYMGGLGIRLHPNAAKPPSRHRRGNKVLAFYEREEVENAIKGGLLNESVSAKLLIRQPVPGTTIDPESVELIVDEISAGPPVSSWLGLSLLDDYEEYPE